MLLKVPIENLLGSCLLLRVVELFKIRMNECILHLAVVAGGVMIDDHHLYVLI